MANGFTPEKCCSDRRFVKYVMLFECNKTTKLQILPGFD